MLGRFIDWLHLGSAEPTLGDFTFKPVTPPPPPPPREPSPMQFDPEDVNAACDICGAAMKSYGPMDTYCVPGVRGRLDLEFRCGAWWKSDMDDIYWKEERQCGKAAALLRELRA